MPKGIRNGSISKRAFVLSLPADMPAKEVVERAAKAEIKLKDVYVYYVRSTSRLRDAAPAKSKSSKAGAGSAESEFRRLAIELGLGKSKDLLRETEQKVAELIAGG
jgi:hypothetical protein